MTADTSLQSRFEFELFQMFRPGAALARLVLAKRSRSRAEFLRDSSRLAVFADRWKPMRRLKGTYCHLKHLRLGIIDSLFVDLFIFLKLDLLQVVLAWSFKDLSKTCGSIRLVHLVACGY